MKAGLGGWRRNILPRGTSAYWNAGFTRAARQMPPPEPLEGVIYPPAVNVISSLPALDEKKRKLYFQFS